LQILEDSGKILGIPVLCIILVIPVSRPENTGYTSIADTGRL
jgi:hypothetical protein